MKHVNIYICTSRKSPRRHDGTGCYILEFLTDKGPVTRTGFVELTNETANSAELTVIVEALRRLNEKCELTIYTEFGQAGIAVESGWLDKWEENGWKTSKNVPVRDSEKWISMRNFLMGHDFHFATGKHEYTEWMNREVIKMEKEKKDV